MTFIVHRVAGELSITIPTNSYYYDIPGNYNDADDFPTLTFYETDNDPILSIASVSTNGTEIYNNADILVSRRFVNFEFAWSLDN